MNIYTSALPQSGNELRSKQTWRLTPQCMHSHKARVISRGETARWRSRATDTAIGKSVVFRWMKPLIYGDGVSFCVNTTLSGGNFSCGARIICVRVTFCLSLLERDDQSITITLWYYGRLLPLSIQTGCFYFLCIRNVSARVWERGQCFIMQQLVFHELWNSFLLFVIECF